MEKMFMRAEEVAEVMEISLPYAYKIMQRMNRELKSKGYLTMTGRVDRKFFFDHFYGTKDFQRKGDV